MNISAPLRSNYLRQSVYIGGQSRNHQPSPPKKLEDAEEGLAGSRPKLKRTFTPVIYADYKAKCEETRVTVDPVATLYSPTNTHFEYSNPLNRVRRMATVYPYRDVGWLVSVLFVIDNGIFLTNGFFGSLPILAPSTKFNGEATIAGPITLYLGAVLFVFGIIGGFIATFNVDRGLIQSHDGKLGNGEIDTGPTTTYQPALLGSSSFVWLPAFAELKTVYLPSASFRAGLLQLAGAATFTVSNIASEPGVLVTSQKPTFIFLPTIIGGMCFLSASIILMIISQDRWWKPKIWDVNWYGYFFSAAGALSFVLTGTLSLLLPENNPASAIATLIGRVTFWFGNLIQLYVLMEFYPN